MNKLRIAVAGGSLGGLFAATLLRLDGHRVRVYERSRAAGSGSDERARRRTSLFPRAGPIAIDGGATIAGRCGAVAAAFVRGSGRGGSAAVRASGLRLSSARTVRSRVALLGDAAFVVRPHTAMSASKAAVDAIALRDHLRRLSVPLALAAYERERISIGTAIAAQGMRLGASLEPSNLEPIKVS